MTKQSLSVIVIIHFGEFQNQILCQLYQETITIYSNSFNLCVWALWFIVNFKQNKDKRVRWCVIEDFRLKELCLRRNGLFNDSYNYGIIVVFF